LLQQCITQSAEEVFGTKQVALGKAVKHSHKPWFDIECRQTRSQFAKLSHAHPDRQIRLKQMKQLYKRKKRAYDLLKAKQLRGLAKADPAAFGSGTASTLNVSMASPAKRSGMASSNCYSLQLHQP
jgi:hypothetical protein